MTPDLLAPTPTRCLQELSEFPSIVLSKSPSDNAPSKKNPSGDTASCEQASSAALTSKSLSVSPGDVLSISHSNASV
jgi:hypothetical protein